MGYRKYILLNRKSPKFQQNLEVAAQIVVEEGHMVVEEIQQVKTPRIKIMQKTRKQMTLCETTILRKNVLD